MASFLSPALTESILKVTNENSSEIVTKVCIFLGLKSLGAFRGVSLKSIESFWGVTWSFLKNYDFQSEEESETVKRSLVNIW